MFELSNFHEQLSLLLVTCIPFKKRERILILNKKKQHYNHHQTSEFGSSNCELLRNNC
jgi:hypothetical protein